MIKEAYVSFEVAKLLKEKGFDETCRAFYKCWPANTKLYYCDNPQLYYCDRSQVIDCCSNTSLYKYNYSGEEMNIAAPTHQMAMAWLREGYKIAINILIACEKTISYTFDIWDFTIIHPNKFVGGTIDLREQQYGFKTYEEAVEAALKYSLENLI